MRKIERLIYDAIHAYRTKCRADGKEVDWLELSQLLAEDEASRRRSPRKGGLTRDQVRTRLQDAATDYIKAVCPYSKIDMGELSGKLLKSIAP